jgi:hypothetical protein
VIPGPLRRISGYLGDKIRRAGNCAQRMKRTNAESPDCVYSLTLEIVAEVFGMPR